MSKMTMSAAIVAAQREEMLRDETVFIMGLDTGPYGGAFGCTRGLWKEFGRERVMDMPIAEAGYVGSAVGAAMTGMRPIAELQFTDWITIASDMLVNQAANMRYTFGGSLSVPMVLRAPVGGYMAAASQHSHMFESWFSFVPGLKVVLPSNPRDAKGLLKSAIRDNNPVLFFEHKVLYDIPGEVPDDGDFLAPLGKAAVEASAAGTVLKLLAGEGERRPVLAPLAVLGEPGEDVSRYGPEGGAGETGEPEETGETGVRAKELLPARAEEQRRPYATPLARRLARERSLDLSSIRGTGPNGRIQKRDVLEFTSAKVAMRNREPMSGMRRTIAARLLESKRTMPHAYYTQDVHMDAAAQLRGDAGLTYNDVIMFAVSRALKRFPVFASSIEGDEILHHGNVDLGMAVSVDGGLLVPVIKNADSLSLRELSNEAKRLAALARDGRLTAGDMGGGCFTVSNLGGYGIREFSAIINPPEAGILAVGAVEDRVYAQNGEVRTGKMMTVTLSADHRLIDGAAAAGFLRCLKELLQEPWRMLL